MILATTTTITATAVTTALAANVIRAAAAHIATASPFVPTATVAVAVTVANRGGRQSILFYYFVN